jgi:hypothetical protein
LGTDSIDNALNALRSANPVARDDRRDDAWNPTDQTRLDAIVRAPKDDPATGVRTVVSLADRRRRRLRRIATGTTFATLGLTLVAWAFIAGRDSTDPMNLLCVNQARTFDTPTDAGVPPLQGTQVRLIGDPISSCAIAWTKPWFDQPAQQPPPLTTCVLPSGVLAVLPGASPQVCDQIGTARWTGRFRDDPAILTAFADRLITWTDEHHCATGPDAMAAARAEISRARLTRWTVVSPETSSAASPCASYGFDFSKRVVEITFWHGV